MPGMGEVGGFAGAIVRASAAGPDSTCARPSPRTAAARDPGSPTPTGVRLASFWNLGQVLIERWSGSGPPLGLEATADHVNPPDQVDVHIVEVEIR